MEGLAALRVLEEGAIAEDLLRALTSDDLRGLSPCSGRLARLLAVSCCWLHAAIAEAPFLRLEASCFRLAERTAVICALRVLRKAVPARGLKAPLDSAKRIEELAGAVKVASLASALHVQRRRGFAAPLVGLLRWQDEAALLGAVSLSEPKSGEFCLSAPVPLPLRESGQLAGFLGLGAAALGPPLPMRIVFAWRAGQLMVAMSMGGLVPERLKLPEPDTSRVVTKRLVQVSISCLDPELPLPEVSLTIPVGRQWVAVPLELPEGTKGRSAAVAAMVRGALCVMTVTDFEGERPPPTVTVFNSLQLNSRRDDPVT